MKMKSPQHEYWHKRVEGQIKDCMNQHPTWFNYRNELAKRNIRSSLAKRIVGEIIVGCGFTDDGRPETCPYCAARAEEAGDGPHTSVPRGEERGGDHCAPPSDNEDGKLVVVLILAAFISVALIACIVIGVAVGLGAWD